MKVESAAVGPQLDRGSCQEKQFRKNSVDGTGGLFPLVPLQLGESGQCVGRRGGCRQDSGRCGGGSSGERREADEGGRECCLQYIRSAPCQDRSAQSRSSLSVPCTLPSGNTLSCPYPPLISAFVCLTPAYRGAVSPSEVGTGSSFFYCCLLETCVSLFLWHAGFFLWLPSGARFSQGGSCDSVRHQGRP